MLVVILFANVHFSLFQFEISVSSGQLLSIRFDFCKNVYNGEQSEFNGVYGQIHTSNPQRLHSDMGAGPQLHIHYTIY